MPEIITVNVLKAMACAGTRTIELTPDTVVTPQARIWAEQAGIRFVGEGAVSRSEENETTSAGTAAPPLTEQQGERGIVTVMGIDKVGIIAGVSSKLAELNVNILDISQTIFGNLFVMTMVIDLSRPDVPFLELQSQLAEVSRNMQVQIVVQKEKVFAYMHRI